MKPLSMMLEIPAMNSPPASENCFAIFTHVSGWTVEQSTYIFPAILPEAMISSVVCWRTASLLTYYVLRVESRGI